MNMYMKLLVFVFFCCLSISSSHILSLRHFNFPKIFNDKGDNDKQGGRVLSFFKIRVGNPKQQMVWHYSGVIRNPLTGSEVRYNFSTI